MKKSIPRISHPVAVLISCLARGPRSPWYRWRRIKRGMRLHHPVWTWSEKGSGAVEVSAFDVARAVKLGVVDADGPVENTEEGHTVRLKATELGRAAHVVWEQRAMTARAENAAKLEANRAASAARGMAGYILLPLKPVGP